VATLSIDASLFICVVIMLRIIPFGVPANPKAQKGIPTWHLGLVSCLVRDPSGLRVGHGILSIEDASYPWRLGATGLKC
jgi:hypothetical protein